MEERLQKIQSRINDLSRNNRLEFVRVLNPIIDNHDGTVDTIIIIYSLINLHFHFIDINKDDGFIKGLKSSVLNIPNQITNKYDHPNKEVYPPYLLDICKNTLVETQELIYNSMIME